MSSGNSILNRIKELAWRLLVPKKSLLERLKDSVGVNRAMAVFVTVNVAISIGVMAFVDYLASAPFIFPSLGPTAFHVFSRPTYAVAAPRNAILGHLIGGVCGLGCLAIFGLLGKESVMTSGMSVPRILASALSVAFTSILLVILGVEHPPALSTTLIFSLGFMNSLRDLGILMGAVILIVIQAIVINRRAKLSYPLWSNQPRRERRNFYDGKP